MLSCCKGFIIDCRLLEPWDVGSFTDFNGPGAVKSPCSGVSNNKAIVLSMYGDKLLLNTQIQCPAHHCPWKVSTLAQDRVKFSGKPEWSSVGQFASSMENHGGLLCAICLDEVETKFQLQNCEHGEFHETCIMDWVAHGGQTCPICRASLQVAPANASGDDDDSDELHGNRLYHMLSSYSGDTVIFDDGSDADVEYGVAEIDSEQIEDFASRIRMIFNNHEADEDDSGPSAGD